MTTPDAGALTYHRLSLVRPRRGWWHGLVTGVVAFVLYIAMMFVLLVPLIFMEVFAPGGASLTDELLSDAFVFDVDRPWSFLLLAVPLILMIPALFGASRFVQGRGAGFLSSVVGRIRWGWLWRAVALAVVVYGVYFAILVGIAAFSGDELIANVDGPGLPLMLGLIVLLIPLQAAAEEYVYRGYLMQLVGRWLRHPAFAILIPVPLFVLGHGYDLWGSLGVGLFAFVAAWLAWRTGGLEAAIAMHAANNLGAFLLGSVGLLDVNAFTSSPGDLIGSACVMGVYTLLVVAWSRRRGIERTAVV